MVTSGEMAQIEAMLCWRLGGWQGHPDYEDIVQEARIAAWRAVDGHREAAAFSSLVTKAMDWSLREFLRSHMCRKDVRPRAGYTPPPTWISLTSFMDTDLDDSGRSHPDLTPPGMVTPDFSPDLVQSVALAAACAALPAAEQEILALYYGERLTQKTIGRRLHCSEQRVHQRRKRALQHLRALLDR